MRISPRLLPADDAAFAECVRELVHEPLRFRDAHVPFSAMGGIRFSDHARPLVEWLASPGLYQEKGILILRAWLHAHRDDVVKFWRHPDGYPHLLIGLALCTFKTSPDVRTFLTERFIKAPRIQRLIQQNRQRFLAGKGHTSEDVASELYVHLFKKVLQDVQMAREECFALLDVAIYHKFLDLAAQAKRAASHVAPQPAPDEYADEEAGMLSEDDVLSRLAHGQRDERLVQIQATIDTLLTGLDLELVLARLRPPLSDRQRQVYALFQDDVTVEEIADRLGLSSRLVYYHIERICLRLAALLR